MAIRIFNNENLTYQGDRSVSRQPEPDDIASTSLFCFLTSYVTIE